MHSSQATWQPFNLSHCIEMHKYKYLLEHTIYAWTAVGYSTRRSQFICLFTYSFYLFFLVITLFSQNTWSIYISDNTVSALVQKTACGFGIISVWTILRNLAKYKVNIEINSCSAGPEFIGSVLGVDRSDHYRHHAINRHNAMFHKLTHFAWFFNDIFIFVR